MITLSNQTRLKQTKTTMQTTDPFISRLTTTLTWRDSNLPTEVRSKINEIIKWCEASADPLKSWGIERKLKPGYRTLFYGASGTCKTLTATLLGKYSNNEVYKIDLSLAISKYIGETEKNLGKLFDKAKNKDWILFFDEADALFGKRTKVQDTHDRYANLEVSYLLKRMEDYPGLVILSTNYKKDIDEAFLRGFNLIIEFKKDDKS